jgi:hypothetical protein
MSITSWLSTPRRLHRLPISLAKDDLDRVPGIAGVFDHLGHTDAGAEERGLDVLIQRLGRRRIDRMVVSDQCQRRVGEVADRGALSQELGIDRDTESLPVLFP